MNTKRLLVALVLLFSLGFTREAAASHMMGADISYECLGNDSFRITLNLYRDCSGIDAPTTATVNIRSASCGRTLNPSLTLLAGSGVEVSDLCDASRPQSSCNGGVLPGVEQYIYSAVVYFPAQCADWVISYSLCCRNGAINRITTPTSYDLYVEARMNNTGGNCNDSPVFSTLPVPYMCAGQQTNYNHGAFDNEGDSLVFSLVCPLDAANTCVTYIAGFSPTQPLSTTGAFGFNSVTGQMTFTPDIPQVGVAAIKVEEYRNGVLIGSTMRDIQMIVISCTNTQPTIPSGITNQVGGIRRDSLTVEVCPGEFISFDFTVTDPDAGNIITITSNSDSLPGSNFSVTGTGTSRTGTFTWTPTAANTGTNILLVSVRDSACPIVGNTIVSFQIVVLEGTTAGPDQRYCTAGDSVQLSAVGGTTFTWSPATGLSDPNIRNPLAAPSTTTQYIVTSNLGGSCNNKDTLSVIVVPNFNLNITPPQDTICRNASTVLTAVTSPAANYTYQWQPLQDLIGGANSANPTVAPFITTEFYVDVTSDLGCTIRDSATVAVQGIGPIVEITAEDNNVCPGDTVQLNGIIYSLDCGQTLVGCSAQNLPVPKTYGTGTANTQPGTPFGGTQEDERWQALYLATDLVADGFGPGTITRLEFEVGTKTSVRVYRNLTIKMGCTDNTSLSTDQWQLANTVVYGPVGYTTSLGLNSFPLSIPFDWDGRTNLVVEICYDNASLLAPDGNDQLLSVAKPYPASMRALGNNIVGCNIQQPQFTYQYIPRTIFHICPPLVTNYTVSWAPTTGLTATNILNPQAVATGIQLYTLTVRDSACEGSGSIVVNIDTSYRVDVTPDDTTLCGGGGVQLNANVLGNPPISTLPCGGSTPCQGPSSVIQLGTGTLTTGSGTPYESAWDDGRIQFLYRASELRAAGLSSSGTISALAFLVANKRSTNPFSGFNIKMTCTNLTSLVASNNFVTGTFTPVYGPVNYTTVLGWNTHTFHTPFDWDGSSNILVEICFDNTVSSTLDDVVAYTATSGTNTVLYDFTDGQNGCTIITPSATTSRANVRFTFCQAPTGITAINWTPAGGLSSTTIPNPIATPTVNTTYTASYSFVDDCVYTDSVRVNVTTFNTTISPSDTICQGAGKQLVATGGVSYAWDALPGLSCYNCPNPFATPDTTTVYYVGITNAQGTCIKRDSVRVVVNPRPVISFGNDSVYCFQGAYVLDAGPGFADYDWSTGVSTQSINITVAGTYTVTVTDVNGCVNSDSIQLTVNNPPAISLGPDTIACLGDTITLDPGAGFINYAWNTTPANTQTIDVVSSGTYVVTVTAANNCPGIDTVIVAFSSPSVDLGDDSITLCGGISLVLDAGSPANTYLWEDGVTTTPTRVVNTAGTYWVVATDTNGCTDSDTVVLTTLPGTPVDIGPDTVTTCNNRSVLFDAGAGYSTYAWSNGFTTRGITVSQAGNYGVTVTDANNCVFSDEVQLVDNTPSVFIGNDTTICQGDSVVFDAGAGFLSYEWSTGPQTQTLTAKGTAVYTVTVTSAGACTATDNARLTVNPTPQPVMPSADTVCSGFLIYPDHFESYLWSPGGSTDSTFVVEESANICVTVTDAIGCATTACVDLVVYEAELFVDGGMLCEAGDTIVLSATPGLGSYFWSTGATTADITATAAGTYTVQAISSQNCIENAEAVVSIDSMSVIASADTVFIGTGGSTTLNANVINGTGNYTYSWSPAESLDSATVQNPRATPSGNTVYTVVVTDVETELQCTAFDTVLVMVDSRFAFPEAFTPNGDTQNDKFGPVGDGITVKEFKIFNRWGQLVWNSPDQWDGTYQGKEQPIGTYSYHIVIIMADNTPKTQKGVFSLLR